MPHRALDHDLPPQESVECLDLEVLAFLGRVVGPFVELELAWPEVLHRNPIMRRLILAVSALELHKRDLSLQVNSSSLLISNIQSVRTKQCNNYALILAYMRCMQI